MVERRIVTTLRIDVVREHILAIVDATVRGVGVALSVRVESRLAEVGCEGGVWQPASRIQKLRLPLLHLCSSFALGGRLLSLFHALALRACLVVHDGHSLTLSWCHHELSRGLRIRRCRLSHSHRRLISSTICEILVLDHPLGIVGLSFDLAQDVLIGEEASRLSLGEIDKGAVYILSFSLPESG